MANEIQRIQFFTHNGGTLVAPLAGSVLLVTGSFSQQSISNPTAEDVGASLASAEDGSATEADISHTWDAGADAAWESSLQITFVGMFADLNVPQLTVDAADVICSSTRATITVDDTGIDPVAEVLLVEFDHVPTGVAGGSPSIGVSFYREPDIYDQIAALPPAVPVTAASFQNLNPPSVFDVTGTAQDGFTLTYSSTGPQADIGTRDINLTWGVTEIETISFSPTPDEGTYTITYLGGTTTNINFNDSTGTIESAIEAAATGGKTVSMSGDYTTTLTIECDQEGNQTEATVDTSALFSGRAHEVQRIDFDLVPDDGTWTVAGESLAYNADAAAVEMAIEAGLGTGVSVTGDYSGGFVITFDDYANHSGIVVDESSITNNANPVTATVSTTTQGNPGTVTATVTTTREGSGPTPVNITITRTTTGSAGTPWSATITQPSGEWRIKSGANFTDSLAANANAAAIEAAWESSALNPPLVSVSIDGAGVITVTADAVGELLDEFEICQTCYVVVETLQNGGEEVVALADTAGSFSFAFGILD